MHVVIAFNTATRVRERLLCRISSLRLMSGAMRQARGVAAKSLIADDEAWQLMPHRTQARLPDRAQLPANAAEQDPPPLSIR
ncbi:hypothetical protein [Xanthomonas hortorum]|uniref:Transposase n=1 Tax=Xanthomonas hortorum pv. pelargonii TaxID=453602 RepID=A0AAW9ZUG3_9XANT|nr:hypothetical protein [Xanthomonas hortorum]MCE4356218.1 hypothetical protein [Xanthomonas hortorum pv. pelargonii]MCM5526127.1 hypothetical protein [Xanthomonas hortorum pv. pelargonii]MCM5538318.1 hypothetical protein [Xanthomonas hortorum pv. pelargonii]MCM5542508.1 hypothetical protein [Xanthomonas hortorum pv. pelargonii]MCM5546297.1 hypothetical protein [Xanthomonas hortorum pv. pelargonii]